MVTRKEEQVLLYVQERECENLSFRTRQHCDFIILVRVFDFQILLLFYSEFISLVDSVECAVVAFLLHHWI
jgi:hypothetical protein